MIGAFAAFGVSFDLAVLAVLSYRAISFWLPTFPGGRRLLPASPNGRRRGGRAVATGARSDVAWPARKARCRGPGPMVALISDLIAPKTSAARPYCPATVEAVIHYTK